MQSFLIFLENLPGTIWSLVAAALYTISTIAVGRKLTPQLRPGWEGLEIAINFSLGAAVFGLIFAVLAMLGKAFPTLILVLALLPAATLVYLERKKIPVLRWRHLLSMPRPEWHAAHYAALIGIILLMAYPLGQTLAWPRGSDMTIYHLVIPRTVLWNHGLIFNPFSHDAGLFYGWQLYALPAYLMGGDQAFQLCSFAALAALLLSAFRILKARYGALTGLIGALVVVAVICGMSRESVVNNDIPLVFVELSLLALALTVIPSRGAACVLGLLGGFAIAVKLIAVATVALAFLVFLWRCKPDHFRLFGFLAVCATISLGPWPVFNFLSSGSPLPHFLLIWPPETGYLPQFRESVPYLMQYFGDWYMKNFYRLFSQGLEFVPALLLGFLFMPFSKRMRTDPLCMSLITIALVKTLLLLALNRFDAALIFHDRYHLAAYVLLTVGGMLCWRHAMLPAISTRPRVETIVLPMLTVISVLMLYRTHVDAVQVNGNGIPDTTATYPSLKNGLFSALKRLSERPGGGQGGIAYDFAAEILPPDAVIATTVIDPYLLQRPFLQMLPVSENMIDLSLPPEQLRHKLIEHGATHLHLTQYSGLNPWMEPVVDKWLENLRKIPALTGTRQLLYLNYPTSKGLQGFYELAPTSNIRPFQKLSGLALTQSADGTWLLRWQREYGADVRVDLRRSGALTVNLGMAASEIGLFPIQQVLPANALIEVTCLIDGKVIQSVALRVLDRSVH